MNKILIALTMLISANVMASTTLVCNDQNSRAVYKLSLNEDSTKMTFTPILRDNSLLSSSVASLRYNEGESNSVYSLYEGNNLTNGKIVVELKNKTITYGSTAEVSVVYADRSKKDSSHKTIMLCEVRL